MKQDKTQPGQLKKQESIDKSYRYEKYIKEFTEAIQNNEAKAAMRLRLEGYDVKTIALILNKKLNTIKSDLYKAKIELEDLTTKM